MALGTPVGIGTSKVADSTTDSTLVTTGAVPAGATVVVALGNSVNNQFVHKVTDDSGLGVKWRIVRQGGITAATASRTTFAYAYCPDGLPSGTTLTFKWSLTTSTTKLHSACYMSGRGIPDAMPTNYVDTSSRTVWGHSPTTATLVTAAASQDDCVGFYAMVHNSTSISHTDASTPACTELSEEVQTGTTGGSRGMVFAYATNIDTGGTLAAEGTVTGGTISATGAQAVLFREWSAPSSNYATKLAALSPTSRWDLDETSGTVADDAITTNDGTYVNSPTLNQTGVPFVSGSKAVQHAAASSHDTTLPLGISLNTDFWFSAWIKTTTPIGTALIRDHTTTNGTIVGLPSGDNLAARVGGIAIAQNGFPYKAISDGEWHHVVLTRNGATGRLFVDGLLVASGALGTQGSVTSPWHLAKNGTNAVYEDVTVDQVAIRSGASMTQAQAQDLYLAAMYYVPTLSPTGIAAGGGFGSPSLGHATPQGLSPTGIAKGGGFGTPGIGHSQPALEPTGIAAGGGFGTPSLGHATPQGLSPTGIAAGGGFGSPTIRGPQELAPTGIAAGGGFGTPALIGSRTMGAVGIPAAGGFGSPAIGFPPSTNLEGAISVDAGVAGDITLELPTRISATFDERWASGLHLGNATPTIEVGVRRGRFNRAYRYWSGEDVNMEIAGQNPDLPWQATWHPDEPYVPVPNVLSFERSRSFSQGGFTTATLVIENIASVAQDDYHAFYRGLYAPFRGYVAPGATQLVDEHGDPVVENEWYDILRRNAQVTIRCGYGDETVKVFTGLIDDVDWTSRPDQITVTLRCFGGKVLADTRVFGWSKDKSVPEPVIFIDADDAIEIRKVADDVDSSGELDDNPATNVSDSDADTAWYSDVSDVPNFTEWIEISVPQGSYSSIVLNPVYDNYDVYVSVFPEALGELVGGGDPTLDGADIPDGEWYDAGLGDVPGVNGGIPFVLHDSDVDSGRQVIELGGTYRMGDGSRIRVSFRNLHAYSDPDNDGYVAAATSFVARKERLDPEAVDQKWVRIQDVADVVKIICRWAGFKDLHQIEETGVSLSKRLVVNRGMSYRDVIKLCEDATGFEFYMADPTEDDRSIGIPVFRRSRIVSDAAPVLTITDDLLLSEIQVKMTNEPLAYIIRVRGRESKEGRTLGADRTKRVWYTFRPPWSGVVHSDVWEKNGGIHTRVIHTNNLFRTTDECRLAAYVIALREAIEAFGAVGQAPAHPGAQLDDHIEVRDLGTGVTSRISVREQRETFTTGEQRSWQMTFSGALVDAEWVQDMVAIIEADPGRSD